MFNYILVGKKDDNEDSVLMNVIIGNCLFILYYLIFIFN